MLLSNYYWYFQSAIPKKICDEIIEYGKSQKKKRITSINRWFW